MQSLARKISDFLRGMIWWADYLLFDMSHLFWGYYLPIKINKILVIEMLYIGDLLVITPIIRALKNKFPEAKIEVMVRPSMKDVLSGNPNINYILTYTPDEIKENFKDVAYRLQMEKYDLAVLLHPGLDYGNFLMSLLLWYARIPFRIGCTRVGFLEGKGFFMHRKTRPIFKLKHKVEDNLDVVKTIGAKTEDYHLELHLSKESKSNIELFLKRHNITKEDDVVVIHAAPQHRTHRWLNERFAQVADKVTRKYNAKVIFTGAFKDEEIIDSIISLMKKKAVKAIGLPLKEYFAIIKRSNLVISVDTSAIHVAAAFDKPTVALFGAGNPKIWAPINKKAITLYKNNVCTSCMKHWCRFVKNPFLNKKRAYECMFAITVKDVMNAVKKAKNF